MNKSITLSVAVAAGVLVAGCSSTPSEEPETASGVPTWVLTPSVDGGLAATGCTPASGNLSVESSRADMLARQQLASSLGVQVQALREDYQRQTQTEEDGIATGVNFEVAAREIVDERLVGSQRVRADYVMLNDEQNFCSMVSVSQQTVGEILEMSAAVAEADTEVFTSSQLREQYMSQEALNRLNDALAR